MASLQGRNLVIFSCFSFLFLFQLSTPRVSQLSTLCSLGCPVYNALSLKRVFVLRSIANSPPGLHCRDKSFEVRRGESSHTSPLELKGQVSLVGSLVQAQEAPEKGLGVVKARALSAPALSCCDAWPGCSLPRQNAAPYKGCCLGNTLNLRRFHSIFCLDFCMPPDLESHADAAI